MKKLAFILPFLVLIAAVVFFAVHRRTVVRHANAEVRAQTATSFGFAEQLALARAACGSGQVNVKEKNTILCSVCPSGADSAGSPGSSAGWTLDGAIPGSFSAKGADEALLHATGCESHANNYGGNYLMQRSGNDWTAVRYAAGGTANNKCQKVPWPGGRDALVCKTSDMHQGIVSEAVELLLFDAARPGGEDRSKSFFISLEDERSNCGFQTSLTAKPHTIQLATIDSVDVLPEAADGNRNVAIDATINRVNSPARSGTTCPVGHPRIYHLVFDNQGDHFDAGEGYVPLDALKRTDCCQLTVNPRVVPGRY